MEGLICFGDSVLVCQHCLRDILSPLIRETGAYRDFAEQKRSGAELAALFQQIALLGQVRDCDAALWGEWFDLRRDSFSVSPADLPIPKRFSWENDERGFIETYAIIVSALASANFSARLFASMFYTLGMAALGVVIFQNIWFVLKHW